MASVGAEYFSTANLDELTEIEKHIEVVSHMTQKYRALENESSAGCHWDDIAAQLERVKAKKQDRKLNLSIIGEFSTGKSTFINALLGKELLASSALQGTTVASTMIEYGEEYMLEVAYLDGSPQARMTFSDFDSLRTKLQQYTTVPSIARKLKSVHVSLPLEILQHDFRIIDTPGTNVTEAWHEDVTIRTIKEESDLSIVLLSAEKQLTATSQAFVNRQLSDILPQCIFVVTKVDLLRPRERRQVLSYIKGKVEEEFELKDAVVLPFASTLVLDAENQHTVSDFPEVAEEDYSNEVLLPKSLLGIRKIIQHTTKQKTIAITKKLTALVDQSYALLSENMDVISSDYQERIALLEKSRTIDLSAFVRQQKTRVLSEFDRMMHSIQTEAEENVESKVSAATNYVISQLDNSTSLDTLKIYINNSLSTDCSSAANLVAHQGSEYHKKQKEAYKKQMGAYNTAFSQVYDSLKIVPVNMRKSSLRYPDSPRVETANIASTAQYIAQELSKENKAFFGGMAAGAAIGTAMLPGVGTVVGGFLGLFAGSMAAPDKAKVRGECKTKLRPQLENYYGGIAQSVLHGVEGYARQLRDSLIHEMDDYIPRYRQEVERQLAQEEESRSQLKQQNAELEKDKQRMRNHKLALESVMKHLNQLGRKES